MNFTVRDCRDDDLPALRELFLAARRATFTWEPPLRFRLEDFDDLTTGERIWVAAAAADDAPLGFAAVWEADAFLHHLFVHPGHQGQGVGSALLAAATAPLLAPATLKCLEANRRARRFYLHRGWEVIGNGSGPDGAWLLMREGHHTPWAAGG